MIRDAKHDDSYELVALCRRLKEITPYAKVPDSVPAFQRTVRQCISSPLGFAMVAQSEDGGPLTGVLLAYANALWFSNQRGVSDFITYAESPGAHSNPYWAREVGHSMAVQYAIIQRALQN